jgi:hypothetical protein
MNDGVNDAQVRAIGIALAPPDYWARALALIGMFGCGLCNLALTAWNGLADCSLTNYARLIGGGPGGFEIWNAARCAKESLEAAWWVFTLFGR